MGRELNDRQEHLAKVDTLKSRPGPFWIEPARNPRPTRWARFVSRLKALARWRR